MAYLYHSLMLDISSHISTVTCASMHPLTSSHEHSLITFQRTAGFSHLSKEHSLVDSKYVKFRISVSFFIIWFLGIGGLIASTFNILVYNFNNNSIFSSPWSMVRRWRVTWFLSSVQLWPCEALYITHVHLAPHIHTEIGKLPDLGIIIHAHLSTKCN